jgi:hypothetical protein
METIHFVSHVSREVAKLLKEAGFDWSSIGYYNKLGFFHNAIPQHDELKAPSLEVAQKWLREVKGLHICVKADDASINCKYYATVVISDTYWGNVQDENKKTIFYNTYEEAQEAGIKKCLTILLEEKK